MLQMIRQNNIVFLLLMIVYMYKYRYLLIKGLWRQSNRISERIGDEFLIADGTGLFS